MIDEFELFRARAYGLRDDTGDDVISEKSGDDVTSASRRRKCNSLLLFHRHGDLARTT